MIDAELRQKLEQYFLGFINGIRVDPQEVFDLIVILRDIIDAHECEASVDRVLEKLGPCIYPSGGVPDELRATVKDLLIYYRKEVELGKAKYTGTMWAFEKLPAIADAKPAGMSDLISLNTELQEERNSLLKQFSLSSEKARKLLMELAKARSDWIDGPPKEPGRYDLESVDGRQYRADVLEDEVGGYESDTTIRQHYRIPSPPKRDPVVDCCSFGRQWFSIVGEGEDWVKWVLNSSNERPDAEATHCICGTPLPTLEK